MFISDNWKDYRLLDASDGERLEKWGKVTLIRPDPQIIWNGMKESREWNRFDGHYIRSKSGGGAWDNKGMPEEWTIRYNDLTFMIRPMGFKHTGIFPEQACNWDYCRKLIRESERKVSVINLFAYTGAATVACAKEGASVCHVDASKGIVACAKENARLSGLAEAPIRYIVDDCFKFVEREIKRGKKYDGIIMDPPSYGRGPGGETWKLEESIHSFIKLTANILSDDPLFFIINSYTTGLSPKTVEYMLASVLKGKYGGRAESGELGLPVESSGLPLPCGAVVRWNFKA
ncbi:MAG: SAM-dependent methyltransferase [Ruminococcaceae bacterium]|nr:SAM-dependent methyltransferase [Oscillospiraceae bacterium]